MIMIWQTLKCFLLEPIDLGECHCTNNQNKIDCWCIWRIQVWIIGKIIPIIHSIELNNDDFWLPNWCPVLAKSIQIEFYKTFWGFWNNDLRGKSNYTFLNYKNYFINSMYNCVGFPNGFKNTKVKLIYFGN